MSEILPEHLRTPVDPAITVGIAGDWDGYTATCQKCYTRQPDNILPERCAAPGCDVEWKNLFIQSRDLEDAEMLGHFEPDRLISMEIFAREAIVLKKGHIDAATTQLRHSGDQTKIITLDASKYL